MILTFFGHDQKFSYEVKNYRLTTGLVDLPFFAQLSDQQKEELLNYGDFKYEVKYDVSDGCLIMEMPQGGNNLASYEMDLRCEVDAAEAITGDSLAKLRVGACSIEAKLQTSPVFSEYKFGDGSDWGEHTFGGVNVSYSLGADLSGVDFSELAISPSSIGDESPYLDLVKTFKYAVNYDINDINLSFNKSSDEAKRYGEYTLGNINLDLNVDYGEIMEVLISGASQSLLNGNKVKLSIADLGAEIPETIAPVAVMMGFPPEIVAGPKIEKLQVGLEPRDGKLFLVESLSLKSNLGSIKSRGTIDLQTTMFENVEVQVDNCPIGVVMMLGQFLPEEEVMKIDQTKTSHLMGISGSLQDGLVYKYGN